MTHVLSDSMRDLIEATILLLKGVSDIEFVWWDEPGGNRWKIIRNNEQQHKVRPTVTKFSSSYGALITQEEILAEFEIRISHFSTLVYFQMKKIAALLKEKSFETNHSGCFPYTQFRQLESFFNT